MTESYNLGEEIEASLEGHLIVKIHLRRRRFCILNGRNFSIYRSSQDVANKIAPRRVYVVAGVKDMESINPSTRSVLFGNIAYSNALYISVAKSKSFVIEADTKIEKQRWLHALNRINAPEICSIEHTLKTIIKQSNFNTQVAIMLMHKHRSDVSSLQAIVDMLAEFSDENINEIEFYLQQIVHIAMHAPKFTIAHLSKLFIEICKSKHYKEHLGNSIHIALQLFWYLEGMIQDKDPETYNKCANALLTVEAIVVDQHFDSSRDDLSSILQIPGLKEKLLGLTEAPELLNDTQRTTLREWIKTERHKRYQYFQMQRDFVKSLTDISERLRFVEPISDRKMKLQYELQNLDIPENTFIPLGRASDPYLRIVKVLEKEGIVFTTHSRAPCLIVFEVVEGEEKRNEIFELKSQKDSLCGNTLKSDEELKENIENIINKEENNSNDNIMKQDIILKKDELEHNQEQQNQEQQNQEQQNQEQQNQEQQNQERDCSTEVQIQVPQDTSDVKVKDCVKPNPALMRLKLGHRTFSTDSISEQDNEIEFMLRERSLNLEDLEVDVSEINTPEIIEQTEKNFETQLQSSSMRRQSIKTYNDGLSNLLRVAESFGETWQAKKERIRKTSLYSSLPGWDVISVISKSNDDMRQEVFALQLISHFQDIFKKKKLPLWLRPYRIISTGNSTGLIETITDAQSIDSLKKKGCGSLREHFVKVFGPPTSKSFLKAQDNFLNSLVAYSIVCYLLQIKDRHNGNILLDSQGHLVHIDFGFLLGIAPGGNWSIEVAPFKLTTEMVDVLDGPKSELFQKFIHLLTLGFITAQRNAESITSLVEIMMHNSSFPCFSGIDVNRMLNSLQRRFGTQDNEGTVEFVLDLVKQSYNNKWTKRYDKFQKITNGISP